MYKMFVQMTILSHMRVTMKFKPGAGASVPKRANQNRGFRDSPFRSSTPRPEDEFNTRLGTDYCKARMIRY